MLEWQVVQPRLSCAPSPVAGAAVPGKDRENSNPRRARAGWAGRGKVRGNEGGERALRPRHGAVIGRAGETGAVRAAKRRARYGRADTACGGDRLLLGRGRMGLPKRRASSTGCGRAASSAGLRPGGGLGRRCRCEAYGLMGGSFRRRRFLVFIPPSPAPARPPLLVLRPVPAVDVPTFLISQP